MTYALLWFGGVKGAPLIKIPQSVAGGLIGRASFDGGVATVVLGLALHWLIAFIWAAIYVYAGRRFLPDLLRKPIPVRTRVRRLDLLLHELDRAPARRDAHEAALRPTRHVAHGLAVHMFGIGLAISLSAAKTEPRCERHSLDVVDRLAASPFPAAATARGPRAASRPSGSARSSSSRWSRSGCAAPARRTRDTARRIGRAPPSPRETPSPSRETRRRPRARRRSVHSVSIARRRVEQPRDLLVGHASRQHHRRQPRAMQNLVRVRVADPAEQPRIGERALERVVLAPRAAPRTPSSVASSTSSPPRSNCAQPLFARARGAATRAASSPPPSAPARRSGTRTRRGSIPCGGSFAARRAPPQPPRDHQMDDDEAARPRARSRFAFPSAARRSRVCPTSSDERRIDRAEHERLRDHALLERLADDAPLERLDVDGDVRELGHRSAPLPRPRSVSPDPSAAALRTIIGSATSASSASGTSQRRLSITFAGSDATSARKTS